MCAATVGCMRAVDVESVHLAVALSIVSFIASDALMAELIERNVGSDILVCKNFSKFTTMADCDFPETGNPVAQAIRAVCC
jgi:hypothetical protein